MSATPATIVEAPPVFVLDLNAVERGVPLSALDKFASYSGLTVNDLLEVVIPARTLKHRRQKNESLSVEESDRLARVAEMYQLAVRVWGSPENARQWLKRPKDRFNGRTPLEVLRTGTGKDAVEEFLYQVDEGVFA